MTPAGIRALRAGPLLAAAMLLPGLAGAFDLPQESAVPGGIKLIRLDGGGPPPYVEADGHRALVVKDGEAWVAVIGIPLAAPLGPRTVRLLEAGGGRDLEFSVGEKLYASQSLKVAPGQVNLSARDLERVHSGIGACLAQAKVRHLDETGLRCSSLHLI